MMANHPNRPRKATVSSTSKAPRKPRGRTRADHDRDYEHARVAVQVTFLAHTYGETPPPIFSTNVAGLYECYLSNLPGEQQVHTCHACRRFIERFGGLVTIDAESGRARSLMWDEVRAPEFYKPAFRLMRARVEAAHVLSVFLPSAHEWGTEITDGGWQHFAVLAPTSMLYKGTALSAEQAMAGERHNVETVLGALNEFKPGTLDQLIAMFEAESLQRADKFLGPLRWLRALHERPSGILGHNALVRAVALAPEGYCHPKASVLGPLLEAIAVGTFPDEIRRMFNAMVHPLKYQRPQAPPAAGNIAAAEALFAKLGLAPALERRFATPSEVLGHALWMHVPGPAPVASGSGVFGHIKPKGSGSASGAMGAGVRGPTVTWTWAKFQSEALPSAERIDIVVPVHGNFIALTTAVHPDAPPILKWDSDEERNTVAWYVYHNGSPCSRWGLTPGEKTVLGVVPFPPCWGENPKPYLGNGRILIIEGAHDTAKGQGNALFPECLREDVHGARATIERYSRGATMGVPESSACGYDLRPENCKCTIRVLKAGIWTTFNIDRWD